MDDSFFAYLQQLELMAFFSAYPLVYAIIQVIAGNSKKEIIKKISSLLPSAYALVGLLYLGLQLKNLYPDYSFENIRLSMQQPFLKIWALLSQLFWIPVLRKKLALSLIHSLPFFLFLVKDIFLRSSPDKHIVRNDMKIYTDSLLINLGSLAAIVIVYLLFRYYRSQIKSTSSH